ncbi:Glyoxylase I 4 [Linum grandiflorum]
MQVQEQRISNGYSNGEYHIDKEEEKKEQVKEEDNQEGPPPMMALNHVSRLCRDVQKSIDFYTKVLGMVLIERPGAFKFDGAWLFNYGVGIHLVQAKDDDRLPDQHRDLDPMDNHISFQCEDMEEMERRLKEFDVKYMKRTLEEENNGTKIDQMFFDDPDGFMIEICNCENLKLVPAGSLGKIRIPVDRHTPPLELSTHDSRRQSRPHDHAD